MYKRTNYIESCYSSFILYHTLSSNGFDCEGTVSKRRKNFDEEIRNISHSFTISNGNTEQKERRNRKTHKIDQINKPTIICDYTKNMCGVDLSIK